MAIAFAQGVTLTRADDLGGSPTPTSMPSPSPTSLPSPTPTTTQSPTPTPTSTAGTEPSFPGCQDLIQQPGDHASWPKGWHQIVGGPLLFGSDDVYSLEGGNYVQCFCPEEGSEGIQTNWWRTLAEIQGWFVENGLQWNLGDYRYLAKNSTFSCDGGGETQPSPTPTAAANPTPTLSPTPTSTLGSSTDSGVGGTSSSSSSSETVNEVAGAIELAFTGSGYADAIKMASGLMLSLGSWVISRKSR